MFHSVGSLHENHFEAYLPGSFKLWGQENAIKIIIIKKWWMKTGKNTLPEKERRGERNIANSLKSCFRTQVFLQPLVSSFFILFLSLPSVPWLESWSSSFFAWIIFVFFSSQEKKFSWNEMGRKSLKRETWERNVWKITIGKKKKKKKKKKS